MAGQTGFWRKIAVVMLTLALVAPVIAACDDDDDEDDTPLLAGMPASSDSVEPVEIGVIIDYTGPGAVAGWLADGVIAFADWYWNDKQGGIQLGDARRPVEFLTYDNQGQIASAAAAARKALMDGVSVITMGGVSGQFGYPIADVTDPEKVLYATFYGDPEILEDYDFTISTYVNMEARSDMIAELIVNKLGAETIGIFCRNMESDHVLMDMAKDKIQALNPDIKTVYEEYPPLDVTDFSPYLTSIRYEEPDVILSLHSQNAYSQMARQMMELGGWGDIRHVAYTEAGSFPGVEEMPGAQGWYVPLLYLQDYGTPGQIEFGALWAQMCQEDSGWCKKYSSNSPVPLSNHPVIYGPLLAAIKAIELAGSDDPAAVAEATRSGDLEYDSPVGYLRIGTDGKSNVAGFYAQVLDGQFVICE